VVGTVSAVEFVVTVAAVIGFVTQLGAHMEASGSRLDLVGALLAGGLLAAPLAPLLVQKLQPDALCVSIGSFISLTNARVLLKSARASRELRTLIYLAVGAVWLLALRAVRHRAIHARDAPSADGGGRRCPSTPTSMAPSERRGLRSLRDALPGPSRRV